MREVVDLGDIPDDQGLRQIIHRHDPDCVVCCVEYTDMDRAETDRETAYLINAFTPARVAAVCREKDILMVMVGTGMVFSGRIPAPAGDDDVRDPISVYGDSRSLGESLVAASGCRSLIVRLPHVYGDGMPLLGRGLALGNGDGTLRILDGQVIAPTFAADAARAVSSLIARGATGTFNICAAGSVLAGDFADMSLRLAGNGAEKIPVNRVPADEFLAPADRPPYNVLNAGKYEALTGQKLRPWDEALAEYLAEHGERVQITDKEYGR